MKKSSYIDLLVQLALWSNSKFGKLIDSQAIKFEYWKGTHVGSCGKFARKSLCHPCAPSSGNHLTLPSIRKLLRGPRLMGDVDTRPRARQLADLHADHAAPTLQRANFPFRLVNQRKEKKIPTNRMVNRSPFLSLEVLNVF